jgi:hypothetical protein
MQGLDSFSCRGGMHRAVVLDVTDTGEQTTMKTKLALHSETLRQLDPNMLDHVVGGGGQKPVPKPRPPGPGPGPGPVVGGPSCIINIAGYCC